MLPSPPRSGSSRGSADAEGAVAPRDPLALERREEARPRTEGAAVPPRSPAGRPGVLAGPSTPRLAAARPLPVPGAARGLTAAAPAAPRDLGRVPSARAAPRQAGEPLLLRPGWWAPGKAGGGEELFSFLLLGACERWCSSKGVKGAGGM